MSDVLVRLHDASFGYRQEPVIEHVDLEIRRAAFLGVVGPNGAGKTTLFRGILGLLPPLAGEVERFTAQLGYVPQREQLDEVYPFTVEEIVQMGGYGRLGPLHGLSRQDRRYALACLEQVGLAKRAKELFASLSGGQRQRVLIARALMERPDLMLLDEPTAGIDRPAVEQVLQLLTRLNRDHDLSILLVAHQFDMVRECATEALWVSDGRVERGPARELLSPESLQRRLFVGRGRAS